MSEIRDQATGDHEALLFEQPDVARTVAPLVCEDYGVYSQDQANKNKLHLHSNDDGKIQTQINKASIEDWGAILDMRELGL